MLPPPKTDTAFRSGQRSNTPLLLLSDMLLPEHRHFQLAEASAAVHVSRLAGMARSGEASKGKVCESYLIGRQRSGHALQQTASIGNCKVVNSPRGSTARVAPAAPGRHHRLLPSAHEEPIFTRLQIFVECDAISAHGHMISFEWNLLVTLDTRLAACDAAKRADLEFPPIALLLQLKQDEICPAGSIRNVEIEQRPPLAHPVLGGGAVHIGVPVLRTHAIAEHAASASADLRLADNLTFHPLKGVAIFPVHADFRRRQVGVAGHICCSGTRRRSRRRGRDGGRSRCHHAWGG